MVLSWLRSWTDHLPAGVRQAFVGDVVDAYEKVIGSSGVFRFMQLRARLNRFEMNP